MRKRFLTVLLLLVFLSPVNAEEARQIAGRVLDEKGNPVDGAAIADFWRANGSGKDEDGKEIDPTTVEGYKLFWGHVGQMEPEGTVRSGADGRFSMDMPDHSFALMAMDAQRLRGGSAMIPKDDDGSEIEIREISLSMATFLNHEA